MGGVLAALSPATDHVVQQVEVIRDDDDADGTNASAPPPPPPTAPDGPAVIPVLQERATKRMTSLGHGALILLLYGGFAALAAVEIARFVTQPPLVIRSLTPAGRLDDALDMNVTVWCDPPACSAVTLTVNYSSSAPETSPACSRIPATTRSIASGQPVPVPVCYSADVPWSTFLNGGAHPPVNGVYVSLHDFNGTSGSGSTVTASALVDISYWTATSSSPGNADALSTALIPAIKRLNVARSEVRTMLFTATATYDNGVLRRAALPTPIHFETDGYRQDNRSDLLIRMKPFVTTEDIRTRRTVVDLLASLGGSFKLLRIGATILVPLFLAVFSRSAFLGG